MIRSARKIKYLEQQETSSSSHKLLHRSTWRADCEEGQHRRVRTRSIFLLHDSLTAELQKSARGQAVCCDTATEISNSTLPQVAVAMPQKQQLIAWQFLRCCNANKIGSPNPLKIRTVPAPQPAHLRGAGSGRFAASSARNANVHPIVK